MRTKKLFALATVLACSVGFCFAQKKAYKEVVIDGVKQNKWVDVESITTYDRDGRVLQVENIKDGYVATWKYEGEMLMATEKQIFPDGRIRTAMYDNFGNILYCNWENICDIVGSSQETWYEYDSMGNRTFLQCRFIDGSNEVKKTTYQYDKDGNSYYAKDSDGTEIWAEFIDGEKKLYSKKLNTVSFSSSGERKYYETEAKKKGYNLETVTSSYTEEYEDFNSEGKKIHAMVKDSCVGSTVTIRRVQGCRSVSEEWYKYNEKGDVLQIKRQCWNEDKNGNIIDNGYEIEFKITNKKNDVSITNYLYDYEYYDDGKLKKKICYRY